MAERESRTDDNPLVSHPVMPMIMPTELVVPSLGRKEILIANFCLVSPSILEKLGMQLRELKVPVAFYYLDGSLARELVEMKIGAHKETISFIIAPDMDRPIVLVLAWSLNWNPSINWRR